MSLGGFAEGEFAVDGDWECFNYCVAENYYNAMLGEDFDLIGEISPSFIENVMYWLNYDGEIVKEEDIEKIRTGLFMTCKNRTFIDAIVYKCNVNFAETYISLGCLDVRLYILCMFYLEIEDVFGEEMYNGTILNMVNIFLENRNQYIEFLSEFFSVLNDLYVKIDKDTDKMNFLKVVRDNVSKFNYSCERIMLDDVCKEDFIRLLVNK